MTDEIFMGLTKRQLILLAVFSVNNLLRASYYLIIGPFYPTEVIQCLNYYWFVKYFFNLCDYWLIDMEVFSICYEIIKLHAICLFILFALIEYQRFIGSPMIILPQNFVVCISWFLLFLNTGRTKKCGTNRSWLHYGLIWFHSSHLCLFSPTRAYRTTLFFIVDLVNTLQVERFDRFSWNFARVCVHSMWWSPDFLVLIRAELSVWHSINP